MKTLTGHQIRLQYFPAVRNFFAADQDYALPTRAWISDTFYPWFWNMRAQMGLRTYSRKNDCDNYARAAAQAAQDCHALAFGNEAEGITVGEFWYVKDDGVLHAISCAIVETGLFFFEPQNGSVVTISEKEFASCIFVRF